MWGKHHSFVQRERERNPQTGGLTWRHSVRHTATQRTWAKLGFVHLLIAGALLECSQESVECCLLKVVIDRWTPLDLLSTLYDRTYVYIVWQVAECICMCMLMGEYAEVNLHFLNLHVFSCKQNMNHIFPEVTLCFVCVGVRSDISNRAEDVWWCGRLCHFFFFLHPHHHLHSRTMSG